MEFKHISVLKQESIEGLNIKPDGIYVDCTTGGGGHSLEIAKRLTTIIVASIMLNTFFIIKTSFLKFNFCHP